eukprot:m51a1_g2124 hypothetical protein (330) ;mRNA; r:1681131-1684683
MGPLAAAIAALAIAHVARCCPIAISPSRVSNPVVLRPSDCLLSIPVGEESDPSAGTLELSVWSPRVSDRQSPLLLIGSCAPTSSISTRSVNLTANCGDSVALSFNWTQLTNQSSCRMTLLENDMDAEIWTGVLSATYNESVTPVGAPDDKITRSITNEMSFILFRWLVVLSDVEACAIADVPLELRLSINCSDSVSAATCPYPTPGAATLTFILNTAKICGHVVEGTAVVASLQTFFDADCTQPASSFFIGQTIYVRASFSMINVTLDGVKLVDAEVSGSGVVSSTIYPVSIVQVNTSSSGGPVFGIYLSSGNFTAPEYTMASVALRVR